MFSRIRKLFKLMSFLDKVEIKNLTNGTLHVKVQGNLVVQTTGDQLYCSKEGQSFHLFNTMHLNPDLDKDILFRAIDNSGVQNLEDVKAIVLEHAAEEYRKWQASLHGLKPEPEKVEVENSCDGSKGCC